MVADPQFSNTRLKGLKSHMSGLSQVSKSQYLRIPNKHANIPLNLVERTSK